MIKDIQELNFPSYATMSAATVSLPDMGEWNITSQIKIDGQIAPDFSFDWEVLFQGHKYIQPLRIPQGSKENTTLNSVIDLTFQHWAIYQLKRFPFVTMQPIDSGTAVADEEVATPSLNLGDFIILFGQVLEYYYGDKITIQLNPDWQYKAEAEVISISHTKVWNVLIEVFYKQFGVRWQIEPNGSADKYVIKVGYPTTEQSHIFEYGFQGGLMKVERQVQSEEICNILKGRGGEKNLPSRYFKNVDPENDTFKADPDWIEELANIYFANLMPATFRSYVQGWKAAHISKYPGYTAVGEANAYAPWAYRKGFTDTKFHQVEFVADEITINPETGDKQVEILPGYSPFVKKDSSLAKYGPLLNSLDNNEEIYPTIQGVTVDPYGRIDEVIEVEPITSDDIEEAAENDAQITTLSGIKSPTLKVNNNARQSFTLSGELTVEQGKTANLITDLTVSGRSADGKTIDGAIIESYSVTLKNKSTGQTHSASGIPSGNYSYEITVNVHNTSGQNLNITVACPTPKLESATPSDKWTNKWCIWVKNIWQTSKQSGETDTQYAERVWRLILGDREGNEAKVVFASGMLAHEDYEFVITATPKYDKKLCKWQTVENGKVVEHEYWSEWCIELGKSDAELDTLGVYLPSVMRQAKAGDFFLFIGIDMPHQYTVWNEIRIDEDWKKPILGDKKDIKPTWVVQTDRVRLNGYGKEDALIRQLHPGDTLRLADKRFIEGDYETLYLSSLTYKYREPSSDDAALNPDVEIVLSDRYEVAANPVATLQGEVSALAKQVGSISNVEQIVRAVADKLYLRKDGLPDRSMSPTEFASLLTSLGFRSGMVGGAGWGIYKDANGNWVIEADRFMARQDFEVNNLVINQVVGQGGTIVESAARMEITSVEDTTNGYKCYFDQHEGTVANLFHVDDVAWCNRFTPENNSLKFYKRRVIEIGVDYVVLSKTYVNGSGIPSEEDAIVQYGNYTDKKRQYVKVRDVIGGGYERYIEGLDSVDAEGVEYYFVGRQIGDTPRWFIGNKDLIHGSGENDGSFIEYKDREFNLNNVVLSVGSRIGDIKLGDLIQGFDDSKYLREALNQSTDIINGLVLTSAILLGYKNQLGERVTMAGHNGLIPDSITNVTKRGKVIASFWGGDMIDKYFDENGNLRTTPLTSGFAASVMRMDGSMYLGGGAHAFNADGSGWLGSEDGIKFSADGSMTFGNGIKINLSSGEQGLKETLESFANILTYFIPENSQGKQVSWDAGANVIDRIRVTRGFYSDSFISAHGANPNGGGSGGNFNLMRDWPASAPDDKTTEALGANLGWELKEAIANLPTTSVNPFALTIQKNGTTLGTYDGSAAKTINISDVASAATLSSHTGNGTIHITAAERTKWNNTSSNLDTILGSNADNVINKWDEIVNFLATYTEADTLANLLGNKADKTTKISAGTGLTGGGTLASDRSLSLATSGVAAGTYFKTTVDTYGRVTAGSNPTTLAGFGITDAYTKTDADNRYVNVSGDTMTGNLTLPRLNVAGSKNSDAYLTSDDAKNVFFSVGGRTSFVINDTEACVRPGNSYNNVFALGKSAARWSNLYSVLGDFSGKVTAQSLKIGDCEITWDSANGGLKFSKGIFSEGFVSAKGANPNGGASGGSSFGRLDSWANYNANGTDALSAALGYGLKTRIDALEDKNYLNDLGISVTGSGNAVTAVTQSADKKTLTFTKGATFLTSHQSLANYVTLDTEQTITANKVFTGSLIMGANHYIYGINESSGSMLHFDSKRTVIGSVGSQTTAATHLRSKTGHLTVGTGNDASYNVLDTGNYASTLDNRYLKLTGGTMTGGLTIKTTDFATQLTVFRNSSGTNAVIVYRNADGELGKIGIGGSAETTAKNDLLFYDKDGNKSKIWHSGNDGSGSGLDADLLDGVHASGFARGGTAQYVPTGTAAARWIRIAECTGYTSYGTIDIINTYYNNASQGIKLIVHNSYFDANNRDKISVVQIGYGGTLFQKARVVFPSSATNKYYIEVYYNSSSLNNTLNIRMSNSCSMALLQSYTEGSIPDGYTSKEFELGVGISSPGMLLSDDLLFSDSGTTTRQVRFKAGGNDYGRIAAGATAANAGWMEIASADDGNEPIYVRQYTGVFTTIKRTATLLDASGNTSFPGQLSVGSLKIGDCVITWDSTHGGLKFSKGIYSDSFVSAKGANSSAGSGGGSGFGLMRSWPATAPANTTADALGANLGWELYQNKLNATKAAIEGLLTGNITSHTHSQYLTAHQSLANYVDKTSAQSISGTKTFGDGNLKVSGNVAGYLGVIRSTNTAIATSEPDYSWQFWHAKDDEGNVRGLSLWSYDGDGKIYNRVATFVAKGGNMLQVSGGVRANNFVKVNGTSSQFLKADGSVDSNSYLLSSSYTAADVLTKLKTVDGSGSGLDADLLDGLHASSFPKLIQGTTNTTGTKYILLGSFNYANTSTANGASFNIRGSIGNFGGKEKNVIAITIGNREGVGFQGFVSNMNPTLWDIGVNDARQIFLIIKTQYHTYDIEVFTQHGTLLSGATVTPADTNFVLLSESTLVNRFGNGKFLGSAASLTTTRKIWGQDFNGTGNVSGRWELDGVTNSSLSFYAEEGYKVIQTWNSKPLMINPLGNNVGIGRTTAEYKLDVSGSIRATETLHGNKGVTVGNAATNGSIEIFNATPFIDFHFGRSSADYTTRLIEEVSGRLAVIGTLRVSVGMYSNGYVTAKGQNSNSDARLKEIIEDFNLDVIRIAKAPSVRFKWKDDATEDVGSIAQYWQDVNPLLTPMDPDNKLTLQYGKAALLSVISVAKKTVNLEERVIELEKENTELKRKIEILERR